jgi:hypothetical protein
MEGGSRSHQTHIPAPSRPALARAMVRCRNRDANAKKSVDNRHQVDAWLVETGQSRQDRFCLGSIPGQPPRAVGVPAGSSQRQRARLEAAEALGGP